MQEEIVSTATTLGALNKNFSERVIVGEWATPLSSEGSKVFEQARAPWVSKLAPLYSFIQNAK